MFYNTNFDVKYFDICKELKKKKNNKTIYTLEDIDIITYKLYQDELCSVFDAKDILDEKIDIGIRKMLEVMKENHEIKCALEELQLQLLPNPDLDDNTNNEYSYFNLDNNEQKKEYEYLLFMTLFSYDIFHLMHKIICLQLNGNMIEEEVLEEVKELVTKVLRNNV